jgi:hypothetical protein
MIDMCPHKNKHRDIYHIIIYIFSYLGTIKISFSRWMNLKKLKSTEGTLFSTIKKWDNKPWIDMKEN